MHNLQNWKNVIVWFFQLGPLTHLDKMEPSLIDERCNNFMYDNEILLKERNEHESFERSETSQVRN